MKNCEISVTQEMLIILKKPFNKINIIVIPLRNRYIIIIEKNNDYKVC